MNPYPPPIPTPITTLLPTHIKNAYFSASTNALDALTIIGVLFFIGAVVFVVCVALDKRHKGNETD